MIILPIFLFLILLISDNTVVVVPANAENLQNRTSFTAALSYVLDGDSVVIRKGKTRISVRLWGIDAPEFDQPSARESRNRLETLTSGKLLTIIPKDIDKYGRLVAIVKSGSVLVNSKLIEEGWAWVHTYYCNEDPCSYWFDLEKKARKKNSGLWRRDNPMAPWVWKRKK